MKYLMLEVDRNNDLRKRCEARFVETNEKMSMMELFKMFYKNWLNENVLTITEKDHKHILVQFDTGEEIIFTSISLDEYRGGMIYELSIEFDDKENGKIETADYKHHKSWGRQVG